MDALQKAARASVAKLCAIYTAAVIFVMAALSFDPTAAFRAGAFLVIALSAGLIFKAWKMPDGKHDGDDAWALISKDNENGLDPHRLHKDALRAAYYDFSKKAMIVALGFWFISMVCALSI